MSETEFRVVEADPRYRVGSDGRVQSRCSGQWRDLKGSPHCQGYRMVDLGGHGTNKQLVHRLVAEAFHGPCPAGKECGHKNDIKTDNRAENLYWCTRAENVADAVRNGRVVMGGERHSTSRFTDAEVLAMLARVRAGETQRSVALAFGTSQPNISGLLRGVSRNDITGLPRRPKPARRTCVA